VQRVMVMTSESERQALDVLAGDLLRTLGGLEFRSASSAAEIEATYRLRYAAVVENGWATPADYPDGLEHDADDGRAVHIVCVDGERVVGSLRLVPPRPGQPLPTERDFELELDASRPAVDAGRVVLAPSHRGVIGQLALTGLVARGWLEARALGADRIVGVASPAAIELYKELGLRTEVLGAPRPYWGEERRPIEIVGSTLTVETTDPGPTLDSWAAPASGVSRRQLLASAGAATLGSIALLGLPEVAAAATGNVAAGPTDRRTVDFLTQIDQVGQVLTGLGYLTRVDGLGADVLFTKPPATSSADPGSLDTSTARLVAVMTAKVEAINVLGQAITGHGGGSIEVHFLSGGGAKLDNPASFRSGKRVATFSLLFQHTLAIDAPDRALGSFTADLNQGQVSPFGFGGKRYQFGKAGLPWSLRATGRGVRTDPATPTSQHFLAGDMGVVDAVTR
jgi:N-acyl-L-homoserine lactone synthetase